MNRKLIHFLLFLLSGQLLSAQQKTRLINNWEFLKQDLGGIREAVRPVKQGNPEDVPLWTKVSLPHCVNAKDAVDPDVNYYQGPSWYRTQLDIQNPYTNGRTLLHFEGAGQKTDVYVYTTKVASHVGGYDEFTVDITDAVEAFKKTEFFQKQFKGQIPVSIRTDNSRDLEMIPSDLSDFNLYGGIYRYLNLLYTPALSIDKLFAFAETDKTGKTGKLIIKTRFYNPIPQAETDVMIKLFDPKGKLVQELSKKINVTKEDVVLPEIAVKKPLLWSTDVPQLYTVEVAAGEYKQSEKIGFRHFAFVEKGPFVLNGKRLLLR